MSSAALNAYLKTVPKVSHKVLRKLDKIIMSAEPRMQSAVKWRIVMYSLDGKWMKFVCAIDAGKHNVFLRFLDGTHMKDTAGKFRYGKATMAMWDIGFNEPIDEKLVTRYVAEAMTVRAKNKSDHSEWKSLGLAAPAQRALVGAGIGQLSDLAKRSESSVSQIHGMGPNAMELLKASMKSKKITFKR
ncbi:MAG: DUF1801 domain-containing protein [Ilumatobacteraceae bacterium]